MTDAAPIDDRPPVSIGGTIAHFRLVSRLGSGGMGVVYRAVDTKLGREVALKVIHPRVAQDADRRRRFIREGRLAAHLTHPCIATVYEVGEADDRVYIAMELVLGDSLTTLVGADRPMPCADALGIIHEVLRGLNKAHEVGVIHRDLKPDNIIVGEDGIVKILDFGVAKRLETFEIDFTDVKTQHGSLVGTPAYMSPEQAAGKEVDARSDIFSVGVVLYEMLTGHQPFKGETWQETIIAINRDEMPPISQITPDVPPEIDDIVRRCLAKRTQDRYANCKELLEDISAFVVGHVTGTFPPTAVTGILQGASRSTHSDIRSRRQSAPPSRARTLVVVGIAAAVTVGVGLAIMSPQSESPRAPEPPPSQQPDVVPSSVTTPTPLPVPPPVSASTGSATTSASADPKPPPPTPRPRPKAAPTNTVLGF